MRGSRNHGHNLMLGLLPLLLPMMTATAWGQDPPAKLAEKSAFASETANRCDLGEAALGKKVADGELSFKAEEVKTLCKDKTGQDCWAALRASFLKKAEERVRAQLQNQRNQLLARTLETDDRLERVTLALQDHADRVLTAVGTTLEKLAPSDKEIDPKADKAEEKANAELAKARETLAGAFSDACDASSAGVIASFHSATAQLQQAAEADLFKALTDQKSGFSRQVRCILREAAGLGSDAKLLQMTCEPGLLLSGEEISEISVMIEGAPMLLYRAQAVTSDELHSRAAKAVAIYPCASGHPKHDLTCDVIPIGERVSTIVVAVHKTRSFSPTYGTLKSLRPEEKRNRLSLALTGAAPSIHVIVEDMRGRVVAARVPVGYARWKVEMGGFFAATPLTDDQLVTEPVTETVNGQTVTKAKVVSFLDKEEWGQETGVYANFIPANYEFFGVSLGFATRSGKSPSVYLGPNLRLRTFGGKGLASLGGGLVMRSVDRFPGLEVNDVFPTDSARLAPVSQQKFSWFIGVNLGFRFGPVGVDSSDE